MKLENIASIESGILVSRIPTGNDMVKVVTNNNFTSLGFSNEYKKIKTDFNKVKKYLLKKDDIVIKTITPFEIIYIQEDDILFTNFVFKITPINKKISSLDLFELLKSQDFNKYLLQNASGSFIQRIQKNDLQNYEVANIDVKKNSLNFNIRKLIQLKQKEIKEWEKILK